MFNRDGKLIVQAFARVFESPTRQKYAQLLQRWQSTNVEPPPAGGHLPSIATSEILRKTRESALRTPEIKWIDEDDTGPTRNIVGGRETRKMNTYQAVRDAMRYVSIRLMIHL